MKGNTVLGNTEDAVMRYVTLLEILWKAWITNKL